jgi:hypothetical protein
MSSLLTILLRFEPFKVTTTPLIFLILVLFYSPDSCGLRAIIIICISFKLRD